MVKTQYIIAFPSQAKRGNKALKQRRFNLQLI